MLIFHYLASQWIKDLFYYILRDSSRESCHGSSHACTLNSGTLTLKSSTLNSFDIPFHRAGERYTRGEAAGCGASLRRGL